MPQPYKPKVLIVEDDEQFCLILVRILDKMNLEIKVVASGALAIQSAAAVRPDLIILDLNLPDDNGLRICQVVRSLYGHSAVPVLILTGMNEPIDKLRGYVHGADAYLTKPCKIDELIATVKSLLLPNHPQVAGQTPGTD